MILSIVFWETLLVLPFITLDTVVRLTPAPGNTSSAGNIVLTVDTAAMRPVSLRYDYDGEQVQVSVLGIKPLETPLKAFAKDNYAGYEFIDFR